LDIDLSFEMYRFYINCNNWNPTRDQWIYSTRCIINTEIERIDKFVFQRDAKFALAGQVLIRYLLSQAFQCKSSAFEIKRTERGRPFIDSEKKFDFNLSHHNQLVCIAGSFDGQIGCDTMEYRVNNGKKETAEYLTNLLRGEFTQNEYDFILNKTNDETIRFSHFYRLWCLKESYVKWLGFGIGFKLSRLNFCIETEEFDEKNTEQILSDTKLELDNKLTDEKIRFDEQIIYLPNNEQQIITLCLTDKNNCQTFIELTIDEVLKGCTPLDENIQGEEKWWNSFHGKKPK
jgi:phosphopantetheinyl transferase